jgi:hypothetical protein
MNGVLVVAVVSSAVAAFRADFPAASVVEAPSGCCLTNASGFEARGLGDNPEAAARAFLARYGGAFGITGKQRLVLRDAPPPGQLGRVRFGREISALPVFDGDLVLGVDAANSVILVNASDVPRATSGRFHISRKAAIRAAMKAIPGLATSDSPRAQRGWKAVGRTVRPVWRVEFVAERPAGDWRTYVDAQTGRVVLRTNVRT